MTAKVIGLFRYTGKAREPLQEALFLEGLGMDKNHRRGGERQLSILVQNTESSGEEQEGLCTRRFKANILIEGPYTLAEDNLLHIGEAVLRVSSLKQCHSECKLTPPCYLTKYAGFVVVEKGGVVCLGDEVK